MIRLKMAEANDLKYSKHLEIISEPSNCATTFTRQETVKEIEHVVYRSGTTSLKLLPEPYKFLFEGVIFKNWSPLLETFNNMLAKLEPNGLMEYWRRFNAYSTTKIDEIGPQVLTMDHLKLGFLACCIPMILAVIAFIGEVALSKCKNYSNNAKKTKTETILQQEVEVSELNHTELQEEFDGNVIEIDKNTTSKFFLEDSNEERAFQIVKITEQKAPIEINNFDEKATCGQRESQVQFVCK